MTVKMITHEPHHWTCEICGRKAYAKINGIPICGNHPKIEHRLLRIQELRDTGRGTIQDREGIAGWTNYIRSKE